MKHEERKEIKENKLSESPAEIVQRNLAKVIRKQKPCHKTHLTLKIESHWGIVGSIQIKKKKKKYKCLEKEIGLKVN